MLAKFGWDTGDSEDFMVTMATITWCEWPSIDDRLTIISKNYWDAQNSIPVSGKMMDNHFDSMLCCKSIH